MKSSKCLCETILQTEKKNAFRSREYFGKIYLNLDAISLMSMSCRWTFIWLMQRWNRQKCRIGHSRHTIQWPTKRDRKSYMIALNAHITVFPSQFSCIIHYIIALDAGDGHNGKSAFLRTIFHFINAGARAHTHTHTPNRNRIYR